MRPVLFAVFFFLLAFCANSQTYSIIDGRAIKLFQEGEELTISRRYDEAIAKFQAAISREPSFLEAYVKASQIFITLGRLDEAEKIAIVGKAKLSGKNAKPKNHADYGWLFFKPLFKTGEIYRSLSTVSGSRSFI